MADRKIVSDFQIETCEIYQGDKCPDSLKKYPLRFHPERITFSITHRTSVVNALKRIMEDEMENKYFHADIEGILENEDYEKYVDKRFLRDRIAGIPINQDLHDVTLKPGLITNKSDKHRIVYAGELIGNYKGKINKNDMFNQSIRLFTLSPGKSIRIRSLVLQSTKGMINAMGGNQVHRTSFVPDKPITTSSSIAPRSMKYNFIFHTNGNLDATKYIHRACDTFIERVEGILKEVKTIDPKKLPYTSEFMAVKKADDTRHHYTIQNESHTFGVLFTDYCLELVKNIPFVSYKHVHITLHSIIIIIDHVEHHKVFVDVLEHLIKVFTNLKGQFKNPKKINSVSRSKAAYDKIKINLT